MSAADDSKARVVVILKQEFAAQARKGLIYSDDPALAPIKEVLAKHRALINFSQRDEFEFHLESARAHGVTDDPFRAWTRDTLAVPPVADRLGRTFALAVAGERAYDPSLAARMAAALEVFEGQGVVEKVQIDVAGRGPKVPQKYFG
jgi:hypothetical protein